MNQKSSTNWNAVVGSLLSILQRHGLKIESASTPACKVEVHDYARNKARQEVKHFIVRKGGGHVWVSSFSQNFLSIRLDLSRDPAEIVREHSVHATIELVVREFKEKHQ